MLSVEAAIHLVLSSAKKAAASVSVDISDALGSILSEDIISPINMPPFRQSAMDGYAVHFHEDAVYTIIDEVKAGDSKLPHLHPGEAVRIFTGAVVPDTANSVVRQEDVKRLGNKAHMTMEVKMDANIRPEGEQLRLGEVALRRGTKINTAHIGLIATLGLSRVHIQKEPSIAIVVTGNELKEANTPLQQGEIYESNGTMLEIALNSLHFNKVHKTRVEDDYHLTKEVLEELIAQHDIVLVSGGISVGDYDFVGKALKDLGVEEIFYKVRQKPGKPLFFGRKDETFVFGLPGNPAASLSCFYIYVYPLLHKYLGALQIELARVWLTSLSDFTVKGDRAQFLKARIQEDGVEILGGQSSSMLQTFGDANALIYIPTETTTLKKGDMVQTIILPH
ncbi:MAG: gephyrin-like molybdotransferase Glp [Bacteroidota bacterium]